MVMAEGGTPNPRVRSTALFAALLLPPAGVGLARLDKIYEYHVCMGNRRHGTHRHCGGRSDFFRLKENS
jgi:hypothetical protein